MEVFEEFKQIYCKSEELKEVEKFLNGKENQGKGWEVNVHRPTDFSKFLKEILLFVKEKL